MLRHALFREIQDLYAFLMNFMLNWKSGKVPEFTHADHSHSDPGRYVVVGMLGCVLVLILSGIDDLRVLFGRDDAPAMNPAESHPTGRPESVILAHK